MYDESGIGFGPDDPDSSPTSDQLHDFWQVPLPSQSSDFNFDIREYSVSSDSNMLQLSLGQ